jgi:hypothetical protein
MRCMIRITTLAAKCLVATLLFASSAAIPQQSGTRYTVEIVVFRTASQTGSLPGGPPATETADDGVEVAPVAVRRFTAAATRLRATAGYRVLAHTAWTQAATSCGGAACRNSVRGASAAQLGLARAGISGKVGLQRGAQSLNLGVDLTINDGGRSYHIQEVRQLKKTDEPQYFDHPAIGVMAVVTPGG